LPISQFCVVQVEVENIVADATDKFHQFKPSFDPCQVSPKAEIVVVEATVGVIAKVPLSNPELPINIEVPDIALSRVVASLILVELNGIT
jgi:hypothetical protein